MRPAVSSEAGRFGAPPSAARIALLTALPSALVLAAAASPWLTRVLEYDRLLIAEGAYWRILTGHFTHWSVDHLAWDLVVFVVLLPLCLLAGTRRTLLTLGLSATLISLAVYAALPEITRYRGLSGLDSALFVLLAVVLLRREAARASRWTTGLLAAALIGFCMKAGYEWTTGAAVFADAARFVPVPLAHVVGALCGMFGGMLGGLAAVCPSPAGTRPEGGISPRRARRAPAS